MLLTNFQVNWLFGSGEETKNKFSTWLPWRPHLLFPIGTIYAIFALQDTQLLPSKFQVNWPFGQEKQKIFLRYQPWWPSWISDRKNFSYILSTKKVKRKAQGVPQSQTAALPRHQEE